MGKNTPVSVYRVNVLTQIRHYNLELSTISSLFLVLDSAIIERFPKLLRLVSSYVNHCILLTFLTSYTQALWFLPRLCVGIRPLTTLGDTEP